MNKIILEVKGLKKAFKKREVIRGIDLKISKGDAFGLIGLNGSGKTVLVKMLLGLILPDEGEIKIFGLPLHSNLQKILGRINFAASYLRLYEEVTVIENLITFIRLYNVKNEKAKLNYLIELFGLQELVVLRKKVKFFSSGEKLKLILARALVNDPEIIFLDEPTVNLDKDACTVFFDFIRKLNKKRKTTIFYISHNLTELISLCNLIGLMHNGKIIKIGPSLEIKNEYLKLVKKHR